MSKFGRRKKRLLCAVMIGVLILQTGICTACGSKEEEISMGRYTEERVPLPDTGYTYLHPMSDGSYYLYGDGADLTKVNADGESNKNAWLWENTANIHIKFSYGVADSGAAVFGYTPKFYTDEESGAAENTTEIRYLYYYVDSNGNKQPLKPHGTDYETGTNLERFAFAPDERLYAASDAMIYRVNTESGEAEGLFQTANPVNEMVFMDDMLIALDNEKAYLYDTAGEKLLEDNSTLNDFVSSHQTGPKSIVLAAARDGENGKMILYLGCRTGLYRYVWGGSLIEQIADGRLLSFGNSQYKPLGMQALADGKFRILFNGNYMVELYYDETLPARPAKELTVYSLKENGRIRYAGQLFQKQHPDVLVNYETGMDGDNTVSKEDALKNLNTRLLAGEGPDVIVLDGIDIRQYAEKGVLKPLDELLAPYREENVLYWNMVEGMRMTEKEEIYGIPMTVYLPAWLSDKKYLEGQQSLDDIVAGMEKARSEHPDGPLLFTPRPMDLLNQLIPACLPAWTTRGTGKESPDTEKIEEFYQTAMKLWELDSAGLDEASRNKWQEDVAACLGTDDMEMCCFSVGQYHDIYNIGETWAQVGFLQTSGEDLMQLHCMMQLYRDSAYDYQKEGMEETVWGKCTGQAQNVYWARTVTGLCEQAKEPELAEEFLTLLLSGQMMDKFWLESYFGGGYTIRRDSLEKILDINNHEYGQLMGYDNYAMQLTYSEAIWPTEEEKQKLYEIMEKADCCYLSDTRLEDVVKEIGLQVLDGSLTPKEGAKEVAGRMSIEMEE